MSSLPEKILNEVGPTNTQLADRSKILALGDQAVPILIDLFLNPTTQYGIINQATLADALIEFSKQENNEADVFIRRIAVGDVGLAGTWGSTAREIVQQHFEWIGVDPSAELAKAEMPPEVPDAPASPDAQKAQAAAVTRIFIAMVQADGVIDEREKRVLREFVTKLGVTRAEFQVLAREKAVVSLADLPTEREEKIELLESVFRLALADGTLAASERVLADKIGKSLGLTADEIDRCLRAAGGAGFFRRLFGDLGRAVAEFKEGLRGLPEVVNRAKDTTHALGINQQESGTHRSASPESSDIRAEAGIRASKLVRAATMIENATSPASVRTALREAADILESIPLRQPADSMRALERESSDAKLMSIRGQIVEFFTQQANEILDALEL